MKGQVPKQEKVRLQMFRVVGLLSLLAFLPACAQVQLEHQSDSFNRASASTMSEQTLLNAVRSSLDLPLSFTKLTKFTAGNMAHGSLAPRFPFGAQAPHTYDLAPNLTLSSGVSSIEYADVNIGGALAKLNEDIPFSTIERYMAQGIDPRLLNTILVEYVEIDGNFMRVLLAHRAKRCDRPNVADHDKPVCNELRAMDMACPETSPQRTDAGVLYLPGGRDIYHFGNRAQTRCEFLAFQTAENLLRLAGYFADLDWETSQEVVKGEDGKKGIVDKKRAVQAIWFEAEEVEREYRRLNNLFNQAQKRAPRSFPGTRRPIIKYSFRSPKSLLTYLGELIALQNHARDSFVPKILQHDNQPITIFKVTRGSAPATSAAISVQGPDGQMYSVRRPEYGSELRDQTLRVLALAGDVVNSAVSEKDIPAPASIIVRPIQ